MKEIMLGTSDTWAMNRSSQQPIVIYWRLSDFRMEFNQRFVTSTGDEMTLFTTEILDTGENYPSILSVAKCNAVRRGSKGQTISEWIYEAIVFSKIQTKNCQDFCPV